MSLIEDRRTGAGAESGVPTFLTAGTSAAGEFRCADCGYGVAVRTVLPVCPMCRGHVWDEPATSPYGPTRL
jgi:rubrerythrin